MPNTDWVERYATSTTAGLAWRTEQSLDEVGSLVFGEVYDQAWIPATWVLRADQTLFCPQNRGHSIQCVDTQSGPMVLTTSRALDSAPFVVHQTRDALCAYAVRLPTKLLAVGSDEATVAMLVDGVEVDRVTSQCSILLGLTISDSREQVKGFSQVVLAGQTVQLVTIAASSTGAAPSLVSVREVTE